MPAPQMAAASLRAMGAALVLALAGCAVSDRSSEAVSRGTARIDANGPLFTGAREITITYDDLWLREDYTRLQSPRMQAEFIYATARPSGQAVLASTPDFDEALASWNLNRAGATVAGTLYRIERDGRAVFYRPYRLTGRGWGCVAVQSSWGRVADDRQARPSDLVFGYVCDRTRPALSPDQALRIVRALSFGDGPAAARAQPVTLADAGGREALIAVARGEAGDGSVGNPAFPLRIGRPVSEPARGSVGIGLGVGYGGHGYYGGPFGYYRYPYGYYPYGYHGGHRDRDRDRDRPGGGNTGGGGMDGGTNGGTNGGGNTGGGAGGGGGGFDPGVRTTVDEAGSYTMPNITIDEAGSYPLPPSGGAGAGPGGPGSGDG